MLISAFAALVSMGSAPRASIFLGKGEKDNAEKTLGNSFSLLVIISLILTITFFCFSKDLLLAFGASENTIDYAVSYMKIYSIGTIFVQLTLGLNAFISAQGFAKVSMMTVLIGAVCNIILDPILIFGFNMGVSGAALATILSQSLSMIWIIIFLTGKKTTLKIKRKNLILSKSIVLPSIALGLAPFIMQSTESIIAVCFNSSLLRYGGDIAVGAMTILTSVMQFSLLPLTGLTQGGQPILSYNYGARKLDRVREAYLKAAISATIISTVSFICFQLFPRQIIGIFGSESEAYFRFAEKFFRIFLFCTFINGLQPITANFFTAIGKANRGIFL